MRAITVRQPWAWAIVHGGKTTENRSRNIAGSYRGPVAIHAGLGFDEPVLDDYRIRAAFEQTTQPRPEHGPRPGADVGAFIGVADLVDAHLELGGCCAPWGDVAAIHLTLENPRPLEQPIPARGQLGLWRPQPDHVDQLLAADR